MYLPAILIADSASSSPAFHMMYSACKLNKQGDNIQPWRTPIPVWKQSVVLCPILTVASWPAYRFLRRQVRWSGIPISRRIFQFVVIHTVKSFGRVKAEVVVFQELSCFFDDPVYVGNLISVTKYLWVILWPRLWALESAIPGFKFHLCYSVSDLICISDFSKC